MSDFLSQQVLVHPGYSAKDHESWESLKKHPKQVECCFQHLQTNFWEFSGPFLYDNSLRHWFSNTTLVVPVVLPMVWVQMIFTQSDEHLVHLNPWWCPSLQIFFCPWLSVETSLPHWYISGWKRRGVFHGQVRLRECVLHSTYTCWFINELGVLSWNMIDHPYDRGIGPVWDVIRLQSLQTRSSLFSAAFFFNASISAKDPCLSSVGKISATSCPKKWGERMNKPRSFKGAQQVFQEGLVGRTVNGQSLALRLFQIVLPWDPDKVCWCSCRLLCAWIPACEVSRNRNG